MCPRFAKQLWRKRARIKVAGSGVFHYVARGATKVDKAPAAFRTVVGPGYAVAVRSADGEYGGMVHLPAPNMSNEADARAFTRTLGKFVAELRSLNGSMGKARADIIGDLRKAKFRLEITKGDGLVVKFPRMGETVMTIHRVGAGASAAPVAAPKAKAPEKKAKAPTKRPQPKRHQHSYVPPAVATDIVSILLDDASHMVQLVGPNVASHGMRFMGKSIPRSEPDTCPSARPMI